MKYIFLDIDGVLNSPGDKNLIENTFEFNKLNLLLDLVRKTDSHIVIISSRRCYQNERNTILKVLDDIYDKVSFLSFQMVYKYRKDEINWYLGSHQCKSYVILDDIDNKYSDDKEVKNHFILINGNDGFTVNDYNKALEILS